MTLEHETAPQAVILSDNSEPESHASARLRARSRSQSRARSSLPSRISYGSPDISASPSSSSSKSSKSPRSSLSSSLSEPASGLDNHLQPPRQVTSAPPGMIPTRESHPYVSGTLHGKHPESLDDQDAPLARHSIPSEHPFESDQGNRDEDSTTAMSGQLPAQDPAYDQQDEKGHRSKQTSGKSPRFASIGNPDDWKNKRSPSRTHQPLGSTLSEEDHTSISYLGHDSDVIMAETVDPEQDDPERYDTASDGDEEGASSLARRTKKADDRARTPKVDPSTGLESGGGEDADTDGAQVRVVDVESDRDEDDDDEDDGEDDDDDDDDDDDEDDEDDENEREEAPEAEETEGGAGRDFIAQQAKPDSLHLQQEGLDEALPARESTPIRATSASASTPGPSLAPANADSADITKHSPDLSYPRDQVPVKKKRKARSPSVDEDQIVMPVSAPTRPTVRLNLSFHLDPTDESMDAYTMDFSKLLLAHLKPRGDPWAQWFEEQRSDTNGAGSTPTLAISTRLSEKGAGTPSEAGALPTALPGAVNPDDDLGDLARLLARYPVQSGTGSRTAGIKKRKKGVEDPYDVGTYDTKDPFVDDSELVVDEPTFFARSNRGFFVSQGPVMTSLLGSSGGSAANSPGRGGKSKSKGAGDGSTGNGKGEGAGSLPGPGKGRKKKPRLENIEGAGQQQQSSTASASVPNHDQPKSAGGAGETSDVEISVSGLQSREATVAAMHVSPLMRIALREDIRESAGTATLAQILAQWFWNERATRESQTGIKATLPNLTSKWEGQQELVREAVRLSRWHAERVLSKALSAQSVGTTISGSASAHDGQAGADLGAEGASGDIGQGSLAGPVGASVEETQARQAVQGADRGLVGPGALVWIAHLIDPRVEVPEDEQESGSESRSRPESHPSHLASGATDSAPVFATSPTSAGVGSTSGKGNAASSTSPGVGVPSNAAGLTSAGSPNTTASSIGTSTASKKRVYDPKPVPALLSVAFAALYALVKQESFAVKSKFPPSLKRPLIQVARLAFDLGVYNNNFFDWLPSLLPYNRFTLRKLTIREFFEEEMKCLESLQNEVLDNLRTRLETHLPQLHEEYKEACQAFTRTFPSGNPEHSIHEEQSMSESPSASAASEKEARSKDLSEVSVVSRGPTNVQPQAPTRKWKFTEDEKEHIWLAVLLGDAITELKNDKHALEKTDGISDIMSRKTVYRKIAERWPQSGWVTSTLMAAQFNSVKKKHERLMERLNECDNSNNSNSTPQS